MKQAPEFTPKSYSKRGCATGATPIGGDCAPSTESDRHTATGGESPSKPPSETPPSGLDGKLGITKGGKGGGAPTARGEPPPSETPPLQRKRSRGGGDAAPAPWEDSPSSA